jgi:hypothetical protein
MKIRGARIMVLVGALAAAPAGAADARAAGASIVVSVSGAQLTLSGARVERFEGDFAFVHLDADYEGKGGQHKGYVSVLGVPQSMPQRAVAMVFGPKLLDFRVEGLPDFMTSEVKEATIKRLAEGVELDQDALMGPNLLPEPLFPRMARGLLRIWPRVEVRKSPAVLVYIDGDPIMATVPGTELQYVVNTDWDLFFHQKAYNHFLRVGKAWYEAYSVQGPWIPLRGELPKDFGTIPEAHPRAHVRAFAGKAQKGGAPLDIVVATEPTELVVFDGEPKLVPIPDTAFSYAQNTDSDVFFAKDGVVLLASGRWFAAHSLDGPWQGLGEDVPPDLAKIPKDHPKAHVLALVPGTEEAKAAVEGADTAVTATVRRDLALEVKLLGPPELVPMQGEVSYVRNAAEDMLAVGDRYYCCRNGVWFAANDPVGPWAVSREVPGAVQTLPPSSPLYHLRFVQVLAYSPTTVTFGYTSGYTGAFVDGGAVVYGTGFAEPGYVAAGVYYALPPLLGLGRHFDPAAGRFFELPPVAGPFTGTSKDVGKGSESVAAGLWPRWGRVGYGYGARELSLSVVRPMEWGAGCVDHGIWPVPLADATETAPKPLPPPQKEEPPAPKDFRRPPTLFVGRDGKLYRLDSHKWYEQAKGGKGQWNEVGLPSRDVELQGALVGQMQPRPRPKLAD